jgi:predicted NodU family carbamoyl transferase
MASRRARQKIARHFRIDDDGLVTTKFPGEVAIGEEMARICARASRKMIAASIQKVTEDLLPVLVNTSFNVHEEPSVNRPAECVRALPRRPHPISSSPGRRCTADEGRGLIVRKPQPA